MVPELGRRRQADFCEFGAGLVSVLGSRSARAVKQRRPVLKNKKNNKNIVSNHQSEPVAAYKSKWLELVLVMHAVCGVL